MRAKPVLARCVVVVNRAGIRQLMHHIRDQARPRASRNQFAGGVVIGKRHNRCLRKEANKSIGVGLIFGQKQVHLFQLSSLLHSLLANTFFGTVREGKGDVDESGRVQ